MGIDRLSTASQDKNTRAAKDLMQDGLIGCIEGAPPAWITGATEPPAITVPWLEDLLSKQDTYRAGALTIFCYAVGTKSLMDMRPFSEGVRGAGELTKKLLPHLSIPATRGNPFETIAKGSPSYVGRKRQSWNELLTWASTDATFDEVVAVAAHLIKSLAELRRDLPPMPELDTEKLTWAAVADVLDSLLSTGSEGAYEQLIVAALVEALYAEDVEQHKAYVTTKPVNATDESSKVAGDVQVRTPGGQVLEAVEVADTDWAGKVGQAVASMKREDLRRFLIVAKVADAPNGASVEAAIGAAQDHHEQRDLAVLDLRSEVRSMLARLDRVSRRRMLHTLYRYLLEYQPLDSRVVAYVEALAGRGLKV